MVAQADTARVPAAAYCSRRRGYHRLPVRPQTGPAVMPNPDVPLALRGTSPARS
jgi:hypothetical protein